MSAHNSLKQLNEAPYEVADPGTGKAIVVDRWSMHVPLTIAASASETNTLAAPTQAGQRIVFNAVSVGSSGTRAITVASAINQTGNTIMTFAALDDSIILESVRSASNAYKWRVVHNDGVGLS